MRRPITLAVFLLLAFVAAGAQAHSAVHHAKPLPRCRKHYVRREVRVKARRHHKLVWVKESRCVRLKAKAKNSGKPPLPAAPAPPTPAPPAAPAAPILRYTATVDASFTQATDDPLAVTYAYSADATSTTTGAQPVDLASIGDLPAGILNFYSPVASGQAVGLVCSMNVGGAVAGGDCTVNYQATGTYDVTIQYIPDGVGAVTDTDTETISPFATSTTEQLVVTHPLITVTPQVLDQNGYPPSSQPASFLITVADEQNGSSEALTGSGVLTLEQAGEGSTVLLDTLGSNYTGSLQVATGDTLDVTTQYLGAPGYSPSVSATMQTTIP
jgi:hypothetical protein